MRAASLDVVPSRDDQVTITGNKACTPAYLVVCLTDLSPISSIDEMTVENLDHIR